MSELNWDDFTPDEVEVIVLAMVGDQESLGKCKYSVIDALLKRQVLIEVAKPMRSSRGETIIKIKDGISYAKLSTNRI